MLRMQCRQFWPPLRALRSRPCALRFVRSLASEECIDNICRLTRAIIDQAAGRPLGAPLELATQAGMTVLHFARSVGGPLDSVPHAFGGFEGKQLRPSGPTVQRG